MDLWPSQFLITLYCLAKKFRFFFFLERKEVWDKEFYFFRLKYSEGRFKKNIFCPKKSFLLRTIFFAQKIFDRKNLWRTKSLAETIFSRKNIWPKKIIGRINLLPKNFFAEKIFSRKNLLPKKSFDEKIF
mgnify:CR=1 FL=1